MLHCFNLVAKYFKMGVGVEGVQSSKRKKCILIFYMRKLIILETQFSF